MLKDSGDRRQFESGAVRDMHKGKGRCDLMPLDVIAPILEDPILSSVSDFQVGGDTEHLKSAVLTFIDLAFNDSVPDAMLGLAVHFEDGAVKYGDNNWRRGIPANVYIDSGVRHYLKWLRGDDDEPHDRAALWNLICCIWTCEHLPKLNTYKKTEDMEK